MAVAIYDLRCAPVTFDFCNFLAMAHMRALARREQTFDLVVRADSYRNVTPREKRYSLKEREWRLRNLLLEVWKITTTCRDVTVTRDPNWKFEGTNLFPEYDPVLRTGVPYLLAHSRAIFLQTGIPPMAFTPSEAARSIASRLIPDHSPTVTLTLRLASFDTIRNSDIDAWDSAIVSLRNRGLDVVVLPDQDDCLNERLLFKKGWPIVEAAAFSLDIRLAIMERAQVNLVSAGGMAAPVWYSTVPYVWFNVLHHGHYVANVDYHRRASRLEIGEDFLWALPSQKIEWSNTEPVALFEKYLTN